MRGCRRQSFCSPKTNSGETDQVWFYDVTADGFSLDDKRKSGRKMQRLTGCASAVDKAGRI